MSRSNIGGTYENFLKFIAALAAAFFICDAAAEDLNAAKKDAFFLKCHFAGKVEFRVSPKATGEIVIMRDVPRSFARQEITNFSFAGPGAGAFETHEAGLNLVLTYRVGKSELLDHCRRNGLAPDATLEIRFEFDYRGLRARELDETAPVALYRMSKKTRGAVLKAVAEAMEADAGPKSVETKGRPELRALENFFAYIAENVKYSRAKQKRTPAATLEKKTGNCVSKTNLFRAMAAVAGIKTCNSTVITAAKRNHDVSHRIAVAGIGGKNVWFCPTNGHFAKIPARYIVFSVGKKCNRSFGTFPVRFTFDVTSIASENGTEDLVDEVLGDLEAAFDLDDED